MKNMKKIASIILSVSALSYITACSNSQQTLIVPDVQQPATDTQAASITRARLDNPPFISQGAEFSAIAMMDDGKIIKYQTFKPAKTPTTIVYQSKWNVLESHPTTTTEATTILKLLSQNGYSKEYATMSERYDAADLTRSTKK